MPSRRYLRLPVEHRTRVTVVTNSGERFIGETGGDEDDLAAPKSDAQIEQKFRALSEDVLGTKRVNIVLDRLWYLEDLGNVAEIPPRPSSLLSAKPDRLPAVDFGEKRG